MRWGLSAQPNGIFPGTAAGCSRAFPDLQEPRVLCSGQVPQVEAEDILKAPGEGLNSGAAKGEGLCHPREKGQGKGGRRPKCAVRLARGFAIDHPACGRRALRVSLPLPLSGHQGTKLTRVDARPHLASGSRWQVPHTPPHFQDSVCISQNTPSASGWNCWGKVKAR